MNTTTGSVLYAWGAPSVRYCLDSAPPECAWQGEVFFDHLRGVIDPGPAPRMDTAPFMLVCHWRDFDWTSQHRTKVTPFDDAAALIAEASRLISEERASTSYNFELWEVFGVRVTRRA